MVRRQLAVDFFLIAHDPFGDGKLRIRTELLGCGLVGAELADLMLARRLGVDGEDLVVLEPGGQLDEIDDYVLEAVASQTDVHPVRAWIEPLQDGLYALIGRKVVTAGVVRRQRGARRLGRGRQPDQFPANNLLAASRPQQDLEELLRTPENFDLASGMLAALIGVLGSDTLLDPRLDRTMLRELLSEIEHHLPGDLRMVCEGVRSLTAEVSLRVR